MSLAWMVSCVGSAGVWCSPEPPQQLGLSIRDLRSAPGAGGAGQLQGVGRCPGASVGLKVTEMKILWEGSFITLFFFFLNMSCAFSQSGCCQVLRFLLSWGGALMFLENKPPPPHEAREGFAHFQEKGSACPVIIRSFMV